MYETDPKTRALQAIYENMNDDPTCGGTRPDPFADVVEPVVENQFDKSQDMITSNRIRREKEAAALANIEGKVNKMDFSSKKSDIENQLKRKDTALEVFNKLKADSTSPEEIQEYEQTIQEIQSAKARLNAELLVVTSSMGDQASIAPLRKQEEPIAPIAELPKPELAPVVEPELEPKTELEPELEPEEVVVESLQQRIGKLFR